MTRTVGHWKEIFEKMGALWIHDGNLLRPHALLTSGNHSNGFFNASKVTEDPPRTYQACRDLWTIFCPRPAKDKHPEIDLVVGSAMGAITISHELASLAQARTGFTEKQADASMELKRAKCDPGTVVLLCEDVMTTGGTTRKSKASVEAKGAVVLPYLLVMVNRSGLTELDGLKIIALIDEEMPIWTPDECPICQQGSEAIRPKGNWDKLNADYRPSF